MSDPEAREVALRELARVRHELADITDIHKPPLGPPDFMERYTRQLLGRIAQLEKELSEYDE